MTKNAHTSPRRGAKTVIDILRRRASHQADEPAYTFLQDGESGEARLTYGQLDRRARSIGARLQADGGGGKHALLMYQPGLECVCAFFGCLYAGAVPVLAPPPRPNRPAPGLLSILADARAAFVLTNASARADLTDLLTETPAHKAPRWLTTEGIPEDLEADWREPSVDGDTLAFLQYTSGSTSAPKGVMVSHGNLLHNLAMISEGFRNGGQDVGVFWLPFYHDMGLVGGILETAYVGGHGVFMSPASFLQRPVRWLQAVTRYRGSVSGGPNFAFRLCADKVTPEQRADLDLSSWRVAFCGAEPIHPQTLQRFAEIFEPHGFRREAFYPCYGMAEATLLISGGDGPAAPVTQTVSRQELERNRVREVSAGEEGALTLVGCGRALPGQKIVITHPDTLNECSPEAVGEIWVSGPSVARGYWGRPEETAEFFAAHLAGTGEGPFLRTGDLGYLRDGELFVTGRLKDLIIIRGHNYYPQDIERTVEQSHPALRHSGGAAFSLIPPSGTEERLVLIQEIDRHHRNLDTDEVIRAVRAAVAQHHGLQVNAVILLKPLSLPRTSSGKPRRQECRNRFLNGELEALAEWRLEENAASPAASIPDSSPDHRAQAPGRGRTAEAIQEWLVSRLSALTRVDALDIDVREPFVNYGLDSVQAVGIAGDLECWLERSLPPTLLYEYPTVASLSRHLAGGTPERRPAAEASDPPPTLRPEPVAIIGVGCRFPGADTPEAFWLLLREGVDAITEMKPGRRDADALFEHDSDAPGEVNTRWGGFLEHVEQFDPDFFNISRREAALIDPQQRILLEVAWEALEDAGLVAEKLAGTRAGVFIGISTNDYGRMQGNDPAHADAYAATGNAFSIAANRLSYAFDFRGPSMAVDTACSSSLVAVHLACQSLSRGECSLALVGGVNLILSPAITMNFRKARMMAADGRCKTFDARADGYVRGEGAGVVVLKPLSRALADGDPIYSVICGSAVNQDGRTNGLMAPNGRAQEAVVAEAYRRAGISPGRVQYVEAHGTGTFLGDPIEVNALGRSLADGRVEGSLCAIGSVKTNIGHLEAAAGVAGLIKVALMLKHREIPPTLNFEQPNPHIPFDRLPLRVQRTLSAWPGDGTEAVAGVSSFGFGGTNAHAVLSSAPRPAETPRADAEALAPSALILPLSAKSLPALRESARRHLEFIRRDVEEASALMPDICYTAGARRTHHDRRRAFVFQSPQMLLEQLATFAEGSDESGSSAGRASRRQPKCAFIFSGQGSQWRGMGRELLKHEPIFRAALSECDRLLRLHADWSLLDELQAEGADCRLHKTEVAQPVLFAVQIALAALWRHRGIVPDAVVGHSAGEVAAAYVAGALRLEDAVRLVYHRGRLMERAVGRGRMAAVELSAEEAQHALAGYTDRLCVACVNGPSSVVFSGDSDALEEVTTSLLRREVSCRVLPVNYAFHSFQMDSAQDEFIRAIHPLDVQPPALPIFSTMTGEPSNGRPLDADYWQRQMRQPVLFAQAVGGMVDEGYDLFLEVGPHPVLTAAVNQCLRQKGREGSVLSSLRRGEDECASMLKSLAALYELGHTVEWARLYKPDVRHVRLPSYAWQHERCWLEAKPRGSDLDADRESRSELGGHPLLGRPLRLADPAGTTVWEKRLDRRRLLYLKDHRFGNVEVLPGAAYIEMALAAAADAFCDEPHALADIKFHNALFLPEEGSCTLQLILSHSDEAEASFRVFARAEAKKHGGAEPMLCAEGKIRLTMSGVETAGGVRFKLSETRGLASAEVSGEDYYRELRIRGFLYGPSFRGIKQLWRGEGEALGRVEVPPEIEPELDAYRLHPAIIDACAQVLMATDADRGRAFIPVGVDEVRVNKRPGHSFWSRARSRAVAEDGAAMLVGDVELLDESGEVLVEAAGLRVKYLESEARGFNNVNPRDWLYRLQWEPKEFSAAEPSGVGGKQSRETWLIFKDLGGVGERLSARLAEEGHRCVEVTPGDSFERLGADLFRISPAGREDVERLFGEAVGEGKQPYAGVVYLWGLDAPEPDGIDAASLERACLLGCGTAVQIVRAMSAATSRRVPRLWVVTRGALTVSGAAERPAIVQSPLWGLGRTIAREHPSIWGGLIDLEGGSPASDDGELVRKELHGGDDENQLAYRLGVRHAARLERWHGDDNRPSALRLRGNGSYLITGGLGGIGLVIARWMVEQGARRLILLGRSQLPARSEWGKVERGSRPAGRIAAIRELESLGASVHLASVDVADEERLTSFLKAYRAEGWPPLRGVVHAAGVLQDQILTQLDETAMAAVFRAKVVGGWLLHSLTEEDRLDFFVMFSSAASMLGSGGQGSYAAANAFLDGLSHYRHAQGVPALSINWGPWAEVGMAAPGERSGRLTSQGVGTIHPEQGRDVFSRLLSQGAAQVCVVPVDWEQAFRQYPEFNASPLLERIRREVVRAVPEAEGETVASIRAAIVAADESERRSLLEAFLSEEVARVIRLPVSELNVSEPMNTLGIDSLMSIELKNRIEHQLGVSVPVVKLLEGPTVGEFAGMLLEQFDENISATPGRTQNFAGVTDGSPVVQLIPIQSSGSCPPFFCVHPGALDVQCYSDLARHMGSDRPFYALQPSTLDNYLDAEAEPAADSTIEQVATACVEALRGVAPRGPYSLGGWSLGGVLAFEIAQQLERQGETVALLALFDSPAPPSGVQPADYDDANLVPVFASYLGARSGRRLSLKADDLRGLGLEERLRRLWEKARRSAVIPPEADPEQLHKLFEIYQRGLRRATRQLWNYRPQIYTGRLSIFRAAAAFEEFGRVFPDAALQWSKLASERLDIYDAPGDHYTMFLEPDVQILAERLSSLLKATAGG